MLRASSSAVVRLVLALAFLVALDTAGAAASPLPFQGTLTISFAFLPINSPTDPVTHPLPDVVLPMSGVADLTGSTLVVPAGSVQVTNLYLPVTGFPLNLLTGLLVTLSNGVGTFSPSGATGPLCPVPGGRPCIGGGGYGGTMPILGSMQIQGSLFATFPLTPIGVGGELAQGGFTMRGAPFTTGIGRVVGSAYFLPTVAASGAATPPLGVGGSLSLIAPAFLDPAGLADVALVTRAELHFVPEPASLSLLAGGLVALAAVSRRARRRR